MRNFPLVIALHGAACSFLIYMIYGLVTEGPLTGTFIRAIGLAALILVPGWLINILVEAAVAAYDQAQAEKQRALEEERNRKNDEEDEDDTKIHHISVEEEYSRSNTAVAVNQ